MFSTLQRYLLRLILLRWLLLFFVTCLIALVLAVALATDSFVRSHAPFSTLVVWSAFFLPASLYVLLPVSLFFTVWLLFAWFDLRGELLLLAMLPSFFRHVGLPVLLVGCLVATLCFGGVMFLDPWSRQWAKVLWPEYYGQTLERLVNRGNAALDLPFAWYRASPASATLGIELGDDVYALLRANRVQAAYLGANQGIKFSCQDGVVILQGVDASWHHLRFDTLEVVFPLPQLRLEPEALFPHQLDQRIHRFEQQGQPAVRERLVRLRRFTYPVLCLLLSMVGIRPGPSFRREFSAYQVGAPLAIVLGYYLLVRISDGFALSDFAGRSATAAAPGLCLFALAWLPNLLLVLLLVWRLARPRRLRWRPA